MKEYGMFLNTNQYEGLYVREITSCLSPVLHVYNVPDNITITDLVRIMKAQDMGYDDFSGKFNSYIFLPKHKWPRQEVRFGMKMSYATLITTVDETKRREMICYA